MTRAGKEFALRLERGGGFLRALTDAVLQIGIGRAQAGVQLQNTFRHAHPRRDGVLFIGLRDEVIRPGGHRLEVVGPPGARGEQRNVSVVGERLGADAAAEVEPVKIGHHPVGDDELKSAALPCVPSLTAISCLLEVMPEPPQRGAEQESGNVVVIGNQGFQSQK